MAPSVRSVLAYLAQIPILQDAPNPCAPQLDSGLQGVDGTLARPAASTSDVTPYIPLSNAPSCPINGPISCLDKKATASKEPSCCFVAPGGRILLTQFWDREVHVGGAEEDWTLHGLWPDLCDGSYKTYCGMTPHFHNVTDILRAYNQSDLLAFMNRYWIANYGSNANLWMHEYNKHASCINTLAPACYGAAYTPGAEVVDYFARATGLFKTLDTFTALRRAGIEPHARTYVPLADVRAVLEQFGGGRVVLRCGGRRRDELHEVWYVYFVQGSLQSGSFVPAQDYGAHGDANNCAPWVRYLPKQHKRPRLGMSAFQGLRRAETHVSWHTRRIYFRVNTETAFKGQEGNGAGFSLLWLSVQHKTSPEVFLVGCIDNDEVTFLPCTAIVLHQGIYIFYFDTVQGQEESQEHI